MGCKLIIWKTIKPQKIKQPPYDLAIPLWVYRGNKGHIREKPVLLCSVRQCSQWLRCLSVGEWNIIRPSQGRKCYHLWWCEQIRRLFCYVKQASCWKMNTVWSHLKVGSKTSRKHRNRVEQGLWQDRQVRRWTSRDTALQLGVNKFWRLPSPQKKKGIRKFYSSWTLLGWPSSLTEASITCSLCQGQGEDSCWMTQQ